MKYFVTFTVECGPGNTFEAPDDATAIETVRKLYNDEIVNRPETVREICVHKDNGSTIMPIYSRNFACGAALNVADSDGEPRPYSLGSPVTIRQSLNNQTVVSTRKDWPAESEETGNTFRDDFKKAHDSVRDDLCRHFGFPRTSGESDSN